MSIFWSVMLVTHFQIPVKGLRCCLVYLRYLATKCVALCDPDLGGLNTFDATPPLSALGFDLAHFFEGVVSLAMVTVCGFRRRWHGYPECYWSMPTMS